MSDPKLQFDYRVRVVSEANLEAMCAHVSGTCHRYYVEEIGRQYASVVYSNPDEYGCELPMVAHLPVCWYGEVPYILMEIWDVRGDDYGDGDQLFNPLLDCPELYRVDGDQWVTKQESDALLVTQRVVKRCGDFSSKGAKI